MSRSERYKEHPMCRKIIIEKLITPEAVATRPYGYSECIKVQVEKMVREGFEFDDLRYPRIDGSPTLHKLEYHINLGNLNYDVTLGKLEKQLTEAISHFLENYTELKLFVDPSKIRVEEKGHKRRVRIDVYENN